MATKHSHIWSFCLPSTLPFLFPRPFFPNFSLCSPLDFPWQQWAMWDLVSGVRPPLTRCIFALPSATNCRTLLEPGHYPLLQETCQSCRQLAGSLPAAILPWPAFVQVPEWHPQGSSLWILVLFSSSSCQVGISFFKCFLSIHFHSIFPKIIFHCCNGLF